LVKLTIGSLEFILEYRFNHLTDSEMELVEINVTRPTG